MRINNYLTKFLLCLWIFIFTGFQNSNAQINPRSDFFWQPYLAGSSGPVVGHHTSYMDGAGKIYIAGGDPIGGTFPYPAPIRVAVWTAGHWDILGKYLKGDGSFTYWTANSMAIASNGDVYVGGHFNEAYNSNGTMVNTWYIAKWNAAASEWQSVGNGLNGRVYAVAIDASDNVYVGGLFTEGTQPDGSTISLKYCGRWNVSLNVWEPIGDGAQHVVRNVGIDNSGGIIVGGDFTDVYNAGGDTVTVNHIARWNGIQWESLGQGLNTNHGNLHIATDNSGNVFAAAHNLVATNNNSGTATGPVVKWDGAQWSSINISNVLYVSDLEADAAGNIFMLHHDDFSHSIVERWNGAAWDRIAEADITMGYIVSIAANYNYPVEYLYMGGEFIEFTNPLSGNNHMIANNALWNGILWNRLIQPGATGEVFVIETDNITYPAQIFVGGDFTSVHGVPAKNIASYDGINWEVYGGGVNGPVYAISPGTDGFFVGGIFTSATNPDCTVVNVNNIAYWSNHQQQWSSLAGGLTGPVYALHSSGTAGTPASIYAGGDFDQAINSADTVIVNSIAGWSWLTNEWLPVGGGLSGGDSVVYDIEIGGWWNFMTGFTWEQVYIGGSFTAGINPDGSTVNSPNIIMWDATFDHWTYLGNGTDDEVYTIELIDEGLSSQFLIGGNFQNVINKDGTSISAPYIAYWAVQDWRSIGKGVNGPVYSVEKGLGYHNLIAAGDFTEATNSDNSTITVNHVALFERANFHNRNSQWHNLGSGTNGPVHALQYLIPCPRGYMGEVLYVGGNYTHAGNKLANSLAKWDYQSIQRRTPHFVATTSSSSSSRRSRGVASFGNYPNCSDRLAKSTVTLSDTIIFDSLGYGESATITGLHHFELFDLKIYDIQNLSNPIISSDSMMVSDANPMAFLMLGVDDTTLYVPNPDGRSIQNRLIVEDIPVASVTANMVQIKFFHGITDAPTVHLISAGDTLAANLSYGESSDPIGINPGIYSVDMIRGSDNQLIDSYGIDVSDKGDGFCYAVLSGFLDPSSNQNGPSATIGIHEVESPLPSDVFDTPKVSPDDFHLFQNYPNPFNPKTVIKYKLPTASVVDLSIYDILGQKVVTLVSKKQIAGNYIEVWDAGEFASGVYLYKLKTDKGFEQVRKLILLK